MTPRHLTLHGFIIPPMKRTLPLIAALLLTQHAALYAAEFKPASVFSNHAVLQCDDVVKRTYEFTKVQVTLHIEPSSGIGQWQHEKGNGVLDYPLKLTGLFIETHRQSLDLTKMTLVKNTLRFKEVSVIGNAK